jgi:regulator of replication initiation timing
VSKGRSSRGEKEYTKLQQVIHENKKLKIENARLRKQLSRAVDEDPDKFLEEKQEEFKVKTHSVKKKDRGCHQCGRGKLEFHEYSKANGEQFYYRKCDFCPHRTRGKRLTPDVDRD